MHCGTFNKSENGFAGTVRTLNVKFVPNDKAKAKGPDYRVLAGNYSPRVDQLERLGAGNGLRKAASESGMTHVL